MKFPEAEELGAGGASAHDDESAGPLRGIRVLDLSRVVAAPFATMGLGELGATVIKVERTGVGDDAHAWGPPFVAGESAYFLSVNRNKYDLAVDLEAVEGREIVRRLALEWADVVVENFKEGSLERWGLALADLREGNERLITATIRGYPQGDPRPGYDFIIQASSGLMSLTGPSDGEFSKVGAPISDLSSGLFLLSGILAALFDRERTGRGQHLSVSLWESQVSLLVNSAQGYLLSGKNPPRTGNAHPQVSPYEVYRTADGPVAIAGGNQRQFAQIAAVLGHREWLEDPLFGTNGDRVVNRAELAERINAAVGDKTRVELTAMLTAAGVPSGPLRTLDEVFSSPEAAAAGIVATVEHQDIGEIPVVRLPWRFSRTEARPRSGPPTLGQHTASILKSLGVDDAGIRSLADEGVVQLADARAESVRGVDSDG